MTRSVSGFGGGGAAVVVNDTVAGIVDLLPAKSTATTDTVWSLDGDSPVMAYERGGDGGPHGRPAVDGDLVTGETVVCR